MNRAKRLTLFRALRQLQKWAAAAGMTDNEKYQALLADMVEDLELLPIAESHVRWPAGFILIGDEWHPVHVLNELARGWAEWRVNMPDGCEFGLVQPFHWAHCNADNEPSLCFDYMTPDKQQYEAPVEPVAAAGSGPLAKFMKDKNGS